MNTELIGQYVTVSRAKMQTNILTSKLTEKLGWKRCKTLCLVKYHQWTGDLFCWHQTVIFLFLFLFLLMSLKVYKRFALLMVCFGTQRSHTIQCFRYLFLLSQTPGTQPHVINYSKLNSSPEESILSPLFAAYSFNVSTCLKGH